MTALTLTDTDRVIIEALRKDARIPNTELAALAGIAPSTCHGRVRALEQAGVITGYHAQIDPEATGLSVSALIFIRVHGHMRDRVHTLGDELRGLPGVQHVYLIGGERDVLLHVSVESVSQLRDFISAHIGVHPAIAGTQTQIVFEHLTPYSN